MADEYDHEGNPNPRTEHLVSMSKNALISEVLTLEEKLAVAPRGASFMGRRLVEDDGVEMYGQMAAFNRREDIKTSHIATIVRPENTRWIVERLQAKHERLDDMTVVEIGAGIGYLAVDLAHVAKRVFAIEADPLFSRAFGTKLYDEKPSNLTWIFGTATLEMATWVPKADLVVIVTGSDEVRLRKLGEQFALMYGDVVMPWQDWNGNKAVIDCRRVDDLKGGGGLTDTSLRLDVDALGAHQPVASDLKGGGGRTDTSLRLDDFDFEVDGFAHGEVERG